MSQAEDKDHSVKQEEEAHFNPYTEESEAKRKAEQSREAAACEARAEADVEAFANWLQDNPPPGIDTLIATHGAFSLIPAWAWEEFEMKLKSWNARRISRLKN